MSETLPTPEHVVLEPPLFRVTVHYDQGSRIDKDRGETNTIIQKATLEDSGEKINAVAKVGTELVSLLCERRGRLWERKK